jgi:hypothetical protein
MGDLKLLAVRGYAVCKTLVRLITWFTFSMCLHLVCNACYGRKVIEAIFEVY